MDPNNDSFNSLGLDGVTMHSTPVPAPAPNPADGAALSSMANMSDEEFLSAFAAGLLAEKGLGEMDDETKSDMIHDLVERITTFVNRAVLEALPSDKLDAINQLPDDTSIEEVNKIIQTSGINVDQITANALEKFRSIYLSANENAEV